MKRRLILAVTLMGLVLPASASAGEYGWEGWIYGNGNGNGQCITYPQQSSCSGWNYWYQINAAHQFGGGYILAGFATETIIRGVYIGAGGSDITYPSAHGMGGWYTKAHTTFCTWDPPLCSTANPSAYVWFRSYA